MRLVMLWLHVLAVIGWIGGVLYQAHVLIPVTREKHATLFVSAARRARRIAWVSVAVVVLTGFYNVTRLGPLDRVMESSAGLLLAGKFFLVLLAIAVAGQRDFTQLPRLSQTLAANADPAPTLHAMVWLDRAVLLLGLAIILLGLALSRA